MSIPSQPLAEVVGRAMQRLREQAGRRQEDVAAAARAHGFGWTDATVAAFEGGRRLISGELLLALPVIYSQALGRPFRLIELFTEPVAVKNLRLSPQRVAVALCGVWKAPGRKRKPKRTPSSFEVGAERTEARHLGFTIKEAADAARTPISLREDAVGEAERKAARKLEVKVKEVSAAAKRLWGHGLTYERDERLDEQAIKWREEGLDPSHRTAQAVRGHITRSLLAELKQELQRQKPEEGQ